MTCKYIDLSSTPYDEQTVEDEHDENGCQGVGNHFSSNPIGGGDCIEINGQAYHIIGVPRRREQGVCRQRSALERS